MTKPIAHLTVENLLDIIGEQAKRISQLENALKGITTNDLFDITCSLGKNITDLSERLTAVEKRIQSAEEDIETRKLRSIQSFFVLSNQQHQSDTQTNELIKMLHSAIANLQKRVEDLEKSVPSNIIFEGLPFTWDDVPSLYHFVTINQYGRVQAWTCKPRFWNNYKTWVSDIHDYTYAFLVGQIDPASIATLPEQCIAARPQGA